MNRKADYYRIVSGGNGNTHIKAEAYYKLGGMNYGTYAIDPRGYYVSVSPVSVSGNGGCRCESYVAFTGYAGCVRECGRKNKADCEYAKEYLVSHALDLIRSHFPTIEVEPEPEFSIEE